MCTCLLSHLSTSVGEMTCSEPPHPVERLPSADISPLLNCSDRLWGASHQLLKMDTDQHTFLCSFFFFLVDKSESKRCLSCNHQWYNFPCRLFAQHRQPARHSQGPKSVQLFCAHNDTPVYQHYQLLDCEVTRWLWRSDMCCSAPPSSRSSTDRSHDFSYNSFHQFITITKPITVESFD